ncbi:hypothetical protein [Ruegeria sp. Ofav3-42]|uniref:hypothetical protein n=1 Tax=Ruegeria sp. Ofav3-42 TaxID=2917759 RepID=UPI001EF6693C|nr:hypothetical protein [Ruegeria sp. Ofav3-42]MCG7522242.1 hypothetical protein [Ruegeria sp. Ofav3-42]
MTDAKAPQRVLTLEAMLEDAAACNKRLRKMTGHSTVSGAQIEKIKEASRNRKSGAVAKRRLKVAALMADGRSATEIAKVLGANPNTIGNDVTLINREKA